MAAIVTTSGTAMAVATVVPGRTAMSSGMAVMARRTGMGGAGTMTVTARRTGMGGAGTMTVTAGRTAMSPGHTVTVSGGAKTRAAGNSLLCLLIIHSLCRQSFFGPINYFRDSPKVILVIQN
jgi:hypothetical protein